jgi:hypothetical protein
MSKKVKSSLLKDEFITNTSKASLNKMLPYIAGAVISSAKFVATGIPSVDKKKKKIDIGLLEIYLILTNKRLMIWKTTWYGTPKELWISIDLDQINKVDIKFSKVFWKLPNVKIHLLSGEKIGFWSAKVYKNRTVKLINVLNTEISKSIK